MANIAGGSIVWKLDADATAFNAALAAADKRARDFQSSLSKIDTSVASVFKSVGRSVSAGSQAFSNLGITAKTQAKTINGSITGISDTITALSQNANISTGVLTSIFTRTNNSGRLLAQDGLTLLNNGIRINSALAKQLGTDLQGAEKAIASGTVASKTFNAALQDIARNQRTYVSSIENAQSSTGRFRDTLLGVFAGNIITSAITSITSRITDLGKSIYDTGLNFEQFRISFDTMLGSSAKAESLLEDIGTFAAQTPFDLPQVVEGAKRLLAYNIEAEKILPTFEALGNIAAGVGKDKLPQLILAFGQIRAATFLTGAELRQFTEAGVPLLDVLAKQSGKTAAQIKADMESGARIPFEEVEKALFGMSKEGGKFFDLMRRQSKTLGGTISNIRDTVKRFQLALLGLSESGEVIEAGLFSVLQQGANNTLNTLNTNSEAIKRNLFTIGAIVADFIIVLRTQFSRLREPFKELAGAFSQLTSQFGDTAHPANTFNTVISALVTSLVLLTNVITAVIKFMKEFVEGLKNGEFWAIGLLAALTPIAALLTTMWAVNQLTSLVGHINSGISTVKKFGEEINNTKDSIDKAYRSLRKFTDEAGKKIEFGAQKTGELTGRGASAASSAAMGVASGIGGAIGGSIAGAITAALASSATVATIAGAIGTALASVAGSILAVVTAPITLIVTAIAGAIVGLFLLIFTKKGREILGTLGKFFGSLPRKILEFVTGPLAYAAGYIVGQIGATVAGAIILVIGGIVRLGILIVEAVITLAKDVTKSISSFLQDVTTATLSFFASLPQRIGQILQSIPGIVSSIFNSVRNFLTITVPAIVNNVGSFFMSLPRMIAEAIASIPSIVLSVFNNTRNFVLGTLPNFIGGIVNLFRQLPGQIVSVFSSLPAILSRIGRGLVDSIINGLRSALGDIFYWGTRLIDSFFRGIQSAVRNNKVLRKALELIGVNFESHSPPIAGPLKEMDKWGINLGEVYATSLAQGLNSFESTDFGLNALEAPNITDQNVSSRRSDTPNRAEITVNVQMDGIMTRSRSDLRDVAKDMISAVNEELRGRSLPEIGGGAI